MTDDKEKETATRGKKPGRQKIVLLAVGLGLAVAAGFGVKFYLEQKQEELAVTLAKDQPQQFDWMFIDAGDADLVIAGRKVYEANCADCHGFNLEGQPDWRRRGTDGILPAPPHDENGHTWHHHDALLFAIVKLGGQALMPPGVKSGMPAYGDVLSDREIDSSLAYIKSRWPSKIRSQQEMRTDRSR